MLNKLLKPIFNKLLLSENDVSLIQEINNASAIEHFKTVTKEDLQPFTYSSNQISDLGQNLKKDGIVIIKDFICETDATTFAEGARNAVKTSLLKVADNNIDFEDESIFIANTGTKLKSYRDFSSYPKTVMLNRKGRDFGMIDIFNYDFSFKNETGNFRGKISEQNILSILAEANGLSLKPSNLNLYYNKDVMHTRPFHVDSYRGRQYKAFLYLTDVNDLSDGPYCFVAKSHSDKRIISINKQLAKCTSGPQTDAYFFDLQNAFPVLGAKGTLVISDQSGIHRGYPQAFGHERIVLVMNFTAK